MALAPVSETMRPIDRSPSPKLGSRAAAVDCMIIFSYPDWAPQPRAVAGGGSGGGRAQPRWQRDEHLGPHRLGTVDLEGAAVQLHQRLGDRQTETGTLLPAGKPSIDLGEGREREGDLVFVMPTPVSQMHTLTPPSARAWAATVTLPPAGVNLMEFADQECRTLAAACRHRPARSATPH